MTGDTFDVRREMNPSQYPFTSGDPSQLRRLNLQAVLRVLHAGGVHTITELGAAARLSRPTTNQAVGDLVAAGWVSESDLDRVSTTVGRPAKGFSFRPEAGYVLGGDIGAFKALVLICDLDGTEISRARRTLEPDWPSERRLAALGEAADDALRAFAPGASAITDAVVATPGTVDRAGGVVFNRVIPGWQGTNPARWFADRFGITTVGVGDMPMAALAEHWRGAAQGIDDVAYLHLGRRAGAAALIGGRPHLGAHGAAPQIGLWRSGPWRPDYRSLLQLDDGPAETGATELFRAATEGDPAARARIDEYADEIVAGLIPMLIAIDPEVLVVGGGISQAGEAIAGPIRQRILEETPFPPDVVLSTLGDEAVALGAIRLALDFAEERLFRY